MLLVANSIAQQHPYSGPRISPTQAGEQLVYSIGERDFKLPLNATYNAFLQHYLYESLGRTWLTNAVQNRSTQPVARLVLAVKEYANRNREHVLKHKPSHIAQSCAERELYTLSNDLATLETIGSLSPSLIARLKRRPDYQGVKYEISVAACLARSGFLVKWIEDTPGAAEFLATHSTTQETFAVETKSRHRDNGNIFSRNLCSSSIEALRADIESLYSDACRKNSLGYPLAIFIDAQIPYRVNANNDISMELDGLKESMERVRAISAQNPAREFFLGISSHGWYFTPSRVAPPHKLNGLVPIWTNLGPRNFNTIVATIQGLYSIYEIPDGNDLNYPIDNSGPLAVRFEKSQLEGENG